MQSRALLVTTLVAMLASGCRPPPPGVAYAPSLLDRPSPAPPSVVAPTPASPTPAAPTPTRRWYAGRMFFVDLAIFATVLPAIVAADEVELAEETAVAYLGMYAVAGSIVHLLHGNRWQAVASLARRVVLPTVSGMVFFHHVCGDGCAEDSRGYVVGYSILVAAFSGVVAMAYDWIRARVDAP